MTRRAFCIACYAAVEPLVDGSCPNGHPASLVRGLDEIPRAVAVSLEAPSTSGGEDAAVPRTRPVSYHAPPPSRVAPTLPVQAPRPVATVEGDASRRLATLVVTVLAIGGLCMSLALCAGSETPEPEITLDPGVGVPPVIEDVATDAVAPEGASEVALTPDTFEEPLLGEGPRFLVYPEVDGLSVSDPRLGWRTEEEAEPIPLGSDLAGDAFALVLGFDVPENSTRTEFRADLLRNDTGTVLLTAGPAPLDPGPATATFPAPEGGWLPGNVYTIDLWSDGHILASVMFRVAE